MLKEIFDQKIKKELMEEFNIKNELRVPRPKMALVNIGIGKLITSNPENREKILENMIYVLSAITSQKPKIIKARKSVSGFKLRKDMPVAGLVTLRNKRLYDFIERLITYVLPRTKEFKGIVKNNLDNKGNLNLGFKDVNVFPEAVSDKIKYNFGFQVNILSNSKNREENIKLWEKLGFPMKI